jgi:Fic/DOC family
MIHPFEDGNGRTARLVMNALLIKHMLPSVIINYADKQRYFDGIVQANKGDLSEFINYIIECYTSVIEEIKESIFISENEDTETVNKIIKPIYVDIQEVFGNKLKVFLDCQVEEINRHKEKEYLDWAKANEELYYKVNKWVDIFNIQKNYSQLGYNIKIIKFDNLNMEKYLDLSKGKAVARTWYFLIEITRNKKTEKIVFFFQHASNPIRKLDKSTSVSLCLARHDGNSYRRLKYEPVQLHEIGFVNNDAVYLLSDDKIIYGEIMPILADYLIYDIMINYF